ncbi:MAG: hypothetical protein KatS3mg082_1551 [Nitrospiraceae bacterium]|nr:MAG: hypothetical protein KatS3mg082_1551 [Nitrospiraceae bacterium]
MTGAELLLDYLTRYFPILLFIVIALAFGVVTLLVSYLVQPKYPGTRKNSARTNCGSEPFSDARNAVPGPLLYLRDALCHFRHRGHLSLSLGPWCSTRSD